MLNYNIDTLSCMEAEPDLSRNYKTYLSNELDEETLALMEEFYRQLRTSQTKAEALQKTQQAIIMMKNPQNFKFVEPFYWASFILIGSPW